MNVNFSAMGMFIATPICGYYFMGKLLSGSLKKVSLDIRFALAVAVGLSVWSIVLMISAEVGMYNAGKLGLVGWIAASIIVVRLAFKGESVGLAWLGERLKKLAWYDFIFVLGLIGLLIMNLYYPNESILGGRDQGVYANLAVYLAHHGKFTPSYPLGQQFAGNGYGFLAGLYNSPNGIVIQFSHLLPLWLAQAFVSFGKAGLFGFNSVLTIIALILFRGFSVRFIRGQFATVATLLLGWNVSEIWLARITLSEIMTQLFLMASLLTITLAIQEKEHKWAALGGLFFGMATLTRVDGFMILAFLIFTHCAVRLLKINGGVDRKFWKTIYLWVVPIMILSLVHYWKDSYMYFRDLAPQLLEILALTVIAVTIYAIIRFLNTQHVSDFLKKKGTFLFLAVAIGAVFLYGYFLRPYLAKGPRGFTEYSLPDLAAYLSPVVVFMAVAGFILSLRGTIAKQKDELLFPLIIGGGISVVYLYNPSISPDQIWAIRRFVPIIIPMFFFFSFVFLEYIVGILRPYKLGAQILMGIIITFLVVFTFVGDKPILFHAENAGAWADLQTLNNEIPKDGIILIPYSENWATPLFMACDRKIVPLTANNDNEIIKTVDTLYKQNKQPIYLVQSTPFGILGYDKLPVNNYEFKLPMLEQTVIPLPRKILTIKGTITISKLLRNSGNEQSLSVGGEHLIGIRENGFYGPETGPSGPFRWTAGDATVEFPWTNEKLPSVLNLSILGSAPNGTNLKVFVNDKLLLNEKAEPGKWNSSIPLIGLGLRPPYKVRIVSDTWKPDRDARILGVAINHLELSNNLTLGSRKISGVIEQGFLQDENDGTGNSFRWTNGDAQMVVPKVIAQGKKLTFTLIAGAAGNDVKILVNGQVVAQQHVQPGKEYTDKVPIADIKSEDQNLKVEILSSTWKPSQTIKGSNDMRTLGVMVRAIRFE